MHGRENSRVKQPHTIFTYYFHALSKVTLTAADDSFDAF